MPLLNSAFSRLHELVIKEQGLGLCKALTQRSIMATGETIVKTFLILEVLLLGGNARIVFVQQTESSTNADTLIDALEVSCNIKGKCLNYAIFC